MWFVISLKILLLLWCEIPCSDGEPHLLGHQHVHGIKLISVNRLEFRLWIHALENVPLFFDNRTETIVGNEGDRSR